MNPRTPDILEKILARKREEINQRQQRLDMDGIIGQAELAEPSRAFIAALESQLQQDRPAIISEIKKASPSKGVLREDFNPAGIARSYQQHGAACLSVLTDADFFQGHETFLQEARGACSLPVLRKDFIIDPWQVYESRLVGADCILLIVAALDDNMLQRMVDIAHKINLDVLVEVHDSNELDRALQTNARLIGINNRSLHTFETTLQTTLDLLKQFPDDRLLVTESGIHTKEDVKLMRDHDVNIFLVGEAFMKADDPGEKLAELFDFN